MICVKSFIVPIRFRSNDQYRQTSDLDLKFNFMAGVSVYFCVSLNGCKIFSTDGADVSLPAKLVNIHLMALQVPPIPIN
jgi:hypothetical protein